MRAFSRDCNDRVRAGNQPESNPRPNYPTTSPVSQPPHFASLEAGRFFILYEIPMGALTKVLACFEARSHRHFYLHGKYKEQRLRRGEGCRNDSRRTATQTSKCALLLNQYLALLDHLIPHSVSSSQLSSLQVLTTCTWARSPTA